MRCFDARADDAVAERVGLLGVALDELVQSFFSLPFSVFYFVAFGFCLRQSAQSQLVNDIHFSHVRGGSASIVAGAQRRMQPQPTNAPALGATISRRLIHAFVHGAFAGGRTTGLRLQIVCRVEDEAFAKSYEASRRACAPALGARPATSIQLYHARVDDPKSI